MLDLNPLVVYFDILVKLLFVTIQQFVILAYIISVPTLDLSSKFISPLFYFFIILGYLPLHLFINEECVCMYVVLLYWCL